MNASKGFYVLLLAIFSTLSVLLIMPFLQYVLMAVLLAYVLHPVHVRLEPFTGSTVSSLLLVFGATVAAILPFVMMIALIASDAMRFVQSLDRDDVALAEVEAVIAQWTGMDVNLAEAARGSVQNIVESLLGSAPGLFGTLVHVVIGIGLAVFILYYLIKDGSRLFSWTRRIVPLPDRVQDDLLRELDSLMWAVLIGHVAVAIIQGVLAGLGLAATGVPNSIFWTFVMILLALVPLVGTFLVWGPAVIWLALTDAMFSAIALLIYGTILVGASDEFLRPLIVGRAKVNPSIIIVGVIGGMYLFGFMGLFFGPVIAGSLKVILENFREHYQNLEPQY